MLPGMASAHGMPGDRLQGCSGIITQCKRCLLCLGTREVVGRNQP